MKHGHRLLYGDYMMALLESFMGSMSVRPTSKLDHSSQGLVSVIMASCRNDMSVYMVVANTVHTWLLWKEPRFRVVCIVVTGCMVAYLMTCL